MKWNSLKVITSTIISSVLLSTLGSISAIADGNGHTDAFESPDVISYAPCDINHDGSVTIIDVIWLNRYLLGDESTLPTDVDRFDANLDKIVNTADSIRVMCEITGNSYTSSYIDITTQYNLDMYTGSKSEEITEYEWMKEWGLSFEDLVNSSNENENIKSIDSSSDKYYKYICSSSSLSTYTLTDTLSASTINSVPTESENIDEILTRSMNSISQVNGSGRDGVVRLTCSSNSIFSGGERGTGFIVGDHVIACAAHSVFIDSTHNHNMIGSSNFAPSLKVTLYNANGTPKNTQLTVKQIHIPYDLIPEYKTYYDYALLTVSEDLSSYTHFNLGTPDLPENATLTSIDTFLFGFPNTTNVKASKGHIASSNSTDYVLRDTCPATNGFSGGPIFAVCDYSVDNGASTETTRIYSALSIHTGLGCGPIFNYKLIHFYRGNQANIGY